MVIVERCPDREVRKVVGGKVWITVVRVPEMVEAKVRVMGSVPVGVVTVVCVTWVPPKVVVYVVGGNVVSNVTGVPLMVVTTFVGDGVLTTMLVEAPPMLVVITYDIGLKPEEVDVSGMVVSVPPTTVIRVRGGGVLIRVTRLPPCEVAMVCGVWVWRIVLDSPPKVDSTLNDTVCVVGVGVTTM